MAEPKVSFRRQVIGVDLKPRNSTPEDNHVEVEVLIHDDGEWFPKLAFSSAYIDEAIEALQMAKEYMKNHCRSYGTHCGDFMGYRFKEEKPEPVEIVKTEAEVKEALAALDGQHPWSLKAITRVVNEAVADRLAAMEPSPTGWLPWPIATEENAPEGWKVCTTCKGQRLVEPSGEACPCTVYGPHPGYQKILVEGEPETP